MGQKKGRHSFYSLVSGRMENRLKLERQKKTKKKKKKKKKKRRRLETTPRPYTQYRSNFHYIVYKKKKTNVVGKYLPSSHSLFGSVDRADRISRTDWPPLGPPLKTLNFNILRPVHYIEILYGLLQKYSTIRQLNLLQNCFHRNKITKIITVGCLFVISVVVKSFSHQSFLWSTQKVAQPKRLPSH